MREIGQKHGAGEQRQFAPRAEHFERPDNIGAAPGDAGRALFRGERLGQNEIAIERVQQAQRRRGVERQPQPVIAEHAADGRAQNESKPEGRAKHSKAPGAFFLRRDVGDVGAGG